MKKIITAFMLFTVTMILSSYSWAISWESDLEGAFQRARAEGKPVMADFYTDWCSWCKRLDKDVYETEDVERLSGKFICVKVNCEKDKGAFAKYGLKGYPTIIFFSSEGVAVETVVGYRKADVFIGIMHKVLGSMPEPPAVRKKAPDEAVPGKDEPAPEKEERGAGDFALSGIMGSKAIVNDKVVVVGDEVDGAKVMEVGRSSVKLRYKEKELTLKIQ